MGAFNTINVSTTDDTQASTSATAAVKPTIRAKEVTSTAVQKSPTTFARDCSDIADQGYTENYGIYPIQPSGDTESFEVVCDLETNEQEWIVFQRRFDGSVYFYLPWEEYKTGFGNLNGEHWLGLEKLHTLTRNGIWQLMIELEDFSKNTVHAKYSNFSIGDESTNYKLNIGEYSGTIGDLLRFNADMAFTTYDQDHDLHETYQCAQLHRGAWWYNKCTYVNLNGLYFGSPVWNYTGMMCLYCSGGYEVIEMLKKSEMKMRRIW